MNVVTLARVGRGYSTAFLSLSIYSGLSLFRPPLGPTKVAAIMRWLDFRVKFLHHVKASIGTWLQYRGGWNSGAWNSEVPLYIYLNKLQVTT